MCGPLHALYVERTGGRSRLEVCFPLPKKANTCLHMLPYHIGIVVLLPLLLLTLGLWYLVALAGTGLSPVAREI